MAITIPDRTIASAVYEANKFYSRAPNGSSTSLYNHLVIFLGQSNSLGAATAVSPDELAADLGGSHTDVHFWKLIDEVYGDMKGDGDNVNGNADNKFGLEMRLLTDLAEEVGATALDPIFGFKLAVGGTAVAFRNPGNGQDNTWNPHESAGELMQDAIRSFDEAIEGLPNRPTIIYPILFDIGEEDCADVRSAVGDAEDFYVNYSRVVFEFEDRLSLTGIHTGAIRPYLNGNIAGGTLTAFPRRDIIRGISPTGTDLGVPEFVDSLPAKRFMINRDLDQGIDYRTVDPPQNEGNDGVHVSGDGFETLAPIVAAAMNHRCIMVSPSTIARKGPTHPWQDITGGKYFQTKPLSAGDTNQVQGLSNDAGHITITRNTTDVRAPDGTFTAFKVEFTGTLTAGNYYFAALVTAPMTAGFKPFNGADLNANQPMTIFLKPGSTAGGDLEDNHKTLRIGFSQTSFSQQGAFLELLPENVGSTVTIDTNDWKDYEIGTSWGIDVSVNARQGRYMLGAGGSDLNGESSDVPGHANVPRTFYMWRMDNRLP